MTTKLPFLSRSAYSNFNGWCSIKEKGNNSHITNGIILELLLKIRYNETFDINIPALF